jgi:anti-anti-sigma regulatory factor
MAYEWRNESDPPVLQCTGEMGHIECGELRNELLVAVSDGRDWSLDLSGVTEAGTLFVQLLMSAKLMAESQGRTLSLANVSTPVRSAFERVAVEIGA